MVKVLVYVTCSIFDRVDSEAQPSTFEVDLPDPQTAADLHEQLLQTFPWLATYWCSYFHNILDGPRWTFIEGWHSQLQPAGPLRVKAVVNKKISDISESCLLSL
jgi:hypothetical protein